MQRVAHTMGETITALLLVAAILLSGVLMSQRVTQSTFYRQSKIISSIFSEDSVGIGEILKDSRSMDVLLKFVGAVANAYVSFELIPVNEASTFTAVYESLGPVVEVERFEYQRRTLVISGISPDETGYQEFMRRLRGKEAFESITGHFYTTVDDTIRFEIQCVLPGS